MFIQAVAEGGDEEDAVDTDWERKKRLRSDDGATNATLAYDQEQRALREAFVAKGLGSDADDSNDGEGSSDDEHGGLHVRKRAKKVPLPTTPHYKSVKNTELLLYGHPCSH